MCKNSQYKIGVRLNQLDCEESLGYYKRAERWDNTAIVLGCVSIAVVLYYYFI